MLTGVNNMFALIDITHKMLSSLDNVKRYLPDVMADCEGVTYLDTKGYVQAGLKVGLNNLNDIEGLENVLKEMGSISALYVVDDCIAYMANEKGVGLDMPRMWCELEGDHQVNERTYFINGSRFYVGVLS